MSSSNTTFDPDAFFANWSDEEFTPNSSLSFRECIVKSFNLPEDDDYVYTAQGSTTLEMTQKAINGGRAHGLHGWYHDEVGKPLTPQYPDENEIAAYTSLFDPSVSLPRALNSFRASAKANTLQSQISTYLYSKYHNTTPPSLALLPSRSKNPRKHKNPYLALWTSSCRTLEYAGPVPTTEHTKISHHVLPVFYHHFGCIVPSYAALHVIAKLAQPAKPSSGEGVKPILDIGSGNGYWTYMLRNFPVDKGNGMKGLTVYAVDNGVSEYRTTWIRDTIPISGLAFLKQARHEPADFPIEGGKGCILLLVYPQATGNFTGPVMKAFRGDTIVVAGTQNGNRFTGFTHQGVDEWVGKELKEWELVLRIPLPSFAGKDEGMFVFQRTKT